MISRTRLESIKNLADGEIMTLGNSDALTVIGGASNVNGNEANVGVKHLGKFVKKQAKHKFHECNCPP